MNERSFIFNQYSRFTMPTSDQEALSPNQEAKREQILQATLVLLAQRGFHGFSIKQLASEAGVAAGTVYLYFKDKQDLIEQLHMEIIRAVANAAFKGWNAEAPAVVRFRLLCRNLWDYCKQYPDTLLCKGQFDQLPPDVLRSQYADAQAIFKPVKELFEEGRHSGDLVDLPDDVLLCISVDTFWQLARKHHLGMVLVDETLLEQVIDATWRGITRADTN